MIRTLIVVALFTSRIAVALPELAVGKPLPDETMGAGTIAVRVVAGDTAKPVANAVVTLATGNKRRTEKTDGSGRAQFANVPTKTGVSVSVKSVAPELARSTFTMPETGGIRLVLSTEKWNESPAIGGMPKPRQTSGMVRPDGAAGTFAVRLSYNDLRDPKPPANVPVMLVGYAADGKVAIANRSTDATGTATFSALDTSELTAYFAFAQLPRNGRPDRLRSEAVVLGAKTGARVILSSHERTAKDPPIDVEPETIGKDKLRVEISGVPDPTAPIEVIDAATGKLLAKGTVKPNENHVELAVKSVTGQVVYAQTTARGETCRSQPLLQIADRGGSLAIAAVPRLLQSFQLRGIFEGNVFAVQMKLELQNNSWFPIQPKGGIDVPFAAGFTGAVLADGTEGVTLTRTGMKVSGPLPPGGRAIIFGFSLPVRNNKARFAMDLPAGVFDGRIRIDREPGVELEAPPGLTRHDTADTIDVSKIVITAGQSLVFTVTAPKPLDPKQAAIANACKSLNPQRRTPLKDLPAPDFTAQTLDGRPFKLSSLRGKQLIIAFNATWNGLRQDQITLPKLAAALGKDTEVIVVLSDGDAAEIEKVFGTLPFRIVLDAPKGDDLIGPITSSWNIRALPETYVVDRAGTVRAHFVSQRDWSTKDAVNCIKALN